MAITYTKHAEEMLLFRNIEKEFVSDCVNRPDKILVGENKRKIYLKDFGKNFLKVILIEENGDTIIITAHWLAKKRVK